MKTRNVVQDKSFAFSIKCIRIYQRLSREKTEYVLSKQLLKSGTSIGANVEEAIGAQSRRDFFAKMSIAYKEARESHYWVRLMSETGYLTISEKESLITDIDELCRLIGRIKISTQRNLDT